MRIRCKCCLGEYDDVLADGMRYFHVCPPLSSAELRELLERDELALPDHLARGLAAAKERDEQFPVPEGAPTNVERELASWSIPREGHRDENIVAEGPPNVARAMRSEGAGVERAD